MIHVVYMVNPMNLASLKFSGHFLVLKAYLEGHNHIDTKTVAAQNTVNKVLRLENTKHFNWNLFFFLQNSRRRLQPSMTHLHSTQDDQEHVIYQ